MKILLKNIVGLVCASTVATVVFTSCLRDSETDTYPMRDAEIVSFSLSNDSIPELATTVFTIDQNHGGDGKIYNKDSLAFLTDLTKFKVIVTYSNDYGTSSLQSIIGTDTTWITSGDSLDVSVLPLHLRSLAYDNEPWKHYYLTVNVHQIDPDSNQYKRVASGLSFLQTEDIKAITFKEKYYLFSKNGGALQLYEFTDTFKTWTALNLTGLPANTVVRDIQTTKDSLYAFTETGELYVSDDAATGWTQIATPYPVVNVPGYRYASAVQKAVLCVVFDDGGKKVFGFKYEGEDWTIGGEAPDNFPVRDYSVFNRETVTLQRLTVIGGMSASSKPLNTVWSLHQDSLKWAQLQSNPDFAFPALIGANIFDYDGKFRVFNGKDENEGYNEKIYYSIDGGITWAKDTVKVRRPSNYDERYGATSTVSPDGKYFYIIGGKFHTMFENDIWQCYRNGATFPKDEE
jgi:hypothetical protein